MARQYVPGVGVVIPESGGGGALPSNLLPLPVNNAGVDGGYADGSVVLRVGAGAQPAGAFTGGGTGNKSILGLFGYDGRPIGSLVSLEFKWTNVVGPTGPTYIPPAAASPVIPYMNLVVDFNPAGPSDIRVLSLMDSGLAAAISAAVGTYTNDGFNVITHAWTAADDVLIVNAPPNPVPGGVSPNVTTGPSWFQNTYSWAALVAANPTAILKDAFTGDGGLPAGAVTPAILLASGDSGNVTRSGKRFSSLKVNGVPLIGV